MGRKPNVGVPQSVDFADKAEVKARNFVVSDTPAGKDQPEENFTPLTPEEWQAEYGLPADQ
jgi:hypothetical protein